MQNGQVIHWGIGGKPAKCVSHGGSVFQLSASPPVSGKGFSGPQRKQEVLEGGWGERRKKPTALGLHNMAGNLQSCNSLCQSHMKTSIWMHVHALTRH